MAKFKGTNGNDTITGTAGDDTIVPLLGQDTVDGGAGYDTLTVDYSSLADAYWFSTIALAADATWSGGLVGGPSDAANIVGFSNIERVVFTATQDDDYLSVDLGSLAPVKSRLSLNGSGGDDTLSVLAGDLTKALSLITAADSTVKANFAALAGWDNYSIGLGKAAGNTLVLGGGDDVVASIGGVDTVDFGAGTDQWTGYYQDQTEDMSFLLSGSKEGSIDIGGTQYATLKNIESVSVQLGTGDDVVAITGGGDGFLNGGDGRDYLTLIKTPGDDQLTETLTVGGGGLITGEATAVVDSAVTHFQSFEIIYLAGRDDDDAFVLDGSATLLSDQGYDIEIEGGEGYDRLELDLQAQGQTVIAGTADGPGFGTATWAGSSNQLSWHYMEGLTVTFGAADDRIGFGVASEVLNVDGGAGFDTIDFARATAGVTLFLDSAGQQSVNDVLVSLKNVEGVIGSTHNDFLLDSANGDRIQGSLGDDIIYSVAASTGGVDVFDGGSGVDAITYEYATGSVAVSLANLSAQNTGAAGIDTLSGFETLVGSAYGDILTGSGGNDTLNGYFGDDVLEGLAGTDFIAGGSGTDTARYTNATAAVTVSLATTTAQNTGGAGTDTLQSIENLIGSTYADKLGGDANANRLSGGRGADTLTGLGGADVFAYASTLDSNSAGYDRITDFSHSAGDKIDLQAIDAIASSTRFNDAFTYIGGNAFHGVAGELQVLGARGGGYFVYGDTNGDKVADLTIFVDGTIPPFSTDFVL